MPRKKSKPRSQPTCGTGKTDGKCEKTQYWRHSEIFATAAPLVWKMLWTFSNHRTDSEDDRKARTKANEECQTEMEFFWRTKRTTTIVCGPAVSKQLNDVDVLLAKVKIKVQNRAFGEAWGLFDEVDAATDKLAERVRDESGFEVNLKVTP